MTEQETSIPDSRHKGHCFVVMPFGHDADEERWFKGWYEAVILPAIEAVGLDPILAATQDEPSAINDEIRSHLVFDEMVVVDLGGRHVTDAPNPNVMYELGIRHAFGLPLVLMAWEGQRLPFDVNNQRAILSRRDFLDLEPTRQKLVRFLKAAQEGRYYNAMDAVAREAQIETTSMVLGEESLLSALAIEIRDLRQTVNNSRAQSNRWKTTRTVKTALGKKKGELWEWAQQNGFDPTSWGKFLRLPMTSEQGETAQSWSLEEWISFASSISPDDISTSPSKRSAVTPELVEQVKMLLPPQPWEKGVHREVAEKLNITDRQANIAIQRLIDEGEFFDQVNGVLIKPDEASEELGLPM